MKLFFCLFALTLSFQSFQASAAPIENLHSFGTDLYRGARPTDLVSMQYLKKIGIKTVIDLQGGDIQDPIYGWIAAKMEPGESPEWISYEKTQVEELGMSFINVPLNSLSYINETEGYQVGRLMKFIDNPANRPIFIHCEYGKDRTGLVVALYRVFMQKWPKQKAYEEMILRGHGFLNQIVTEDMDRFFWGATTDVP